MLIVTFCLASSKLVRVHILYIFELRVKVCPNVQTATTVVDIGFWNN